MRNPFEKATPVATKLKILLFGTFGSGKTLAALSFPRVAYVSAEGGADLYGGRGFEFDTVSCKTVTELQQIIQFIREDNGKTYDTLVIDPITTFYDVLKEAYARKTKTGELGFKEWGQINNQMKALYTALTDLPVHVVIIARESTEYETRAGNLTKTGVKPDSDKSLGYLFDFTIRMNADHSGTVLKSRGVQLGDLKEVNWSVFEPIAKGVKEGKKVTHTSEETAAGKQAEDLKWSEEEAKEFAEAWIAKGLDLSEIKAALGIKNRLGEWERSAKTADAVVEKWHKEQLGA